MTVRLCDEEVSLVVECRRLLVMENAPVCECDPRCRRGVRLGWVICLERVARSSNAGLISGEVAPGHRRGL